jgi:hypothetical protein
MPVHSLNSIPQIDGLLFDAEKRSEIAKSLNLKYNTWKHKNGLTYHILKYDKDWLVRENIKSIGLLRSVIFKDDGTVVSFAPPKSLLTETLNIDLKSDYVAETFVEGTMINVFYEAETTSWEIATRSSVGGGTCFFMENGFKEENTFKYMFDEVCQSVGLNLDNLNKKYVYSFVMQHPRNRIVTIIKEMSLYLVDVYQIEDNKTIRVVSINNDFEDLGIEKSKVNLVNKISLKNEEDLHKCIESMASINTPYDNVGVVIRNNIGERYKFRNPNYEHVRELRGNQPKLQYHYINLRQTGKVAEYLQYYKEHKKPFNDFRNMIHDYTNELLSNYIRCYIKKEKTLKEFPEKYRVHMYTLHHKIYLKTLMPEKKYVNKEVVVHYFNGLHPAKQMFVMNYDMRKNHTDGENNIMTDTITNDTITNDTITNDTITNDTITNDTITNDTVDVAL